MGQDQIKIRYLDKGCLATKRVFILLKGTLAFEQNFFFIEYILAEIPKGGQIILFVHDYMVSMLAEFLQVKALCNMQDNLLQVKALCNIQDNLLQVKDLCKTIF